MPNPLLRADCSRCAALCCVAFAFDRSESFAFDKPADTPCRNLDGGHRCTVHDGLAERGFGGCVAFDCHGAGQAVTQGMFGGRSWRDDPALLPDMMDAFRLMRRVHEMKLLVHEAHGLALGDDAMGQLATFERALDPADGSWTLAGLRAWADSGLEAEVRSFLPSLRPAHERSFDSAA